MHLIAFITEGAQIRRILDHIGMDSEPPQISPARGPPLWDDCSDAQTVHGEGWVGAVAQHLFGVTSLQQAPADEGAQDTAA